MHRVFYPRDERLHCRRPVHILWTNTNGRCLPERQFRFYHFVALLPMTDIVPTELKVINDSNNSVEMTDASWEVHLQGKLSSPCSANEMNDLPLEIDVSQVPHPVNIDCIIEVNF